MSDDQLFPAEKKSPAGLRRDRDDLWDALVSVLGYSPTGKRMCNVWGKIITELLADGRTPKDVHDAGRGYSKLFPRDDTPLTPGKLINHFDPALAKARHSRRSSMPRTKRRLVSVDEAIRRKEAEG